jgi:hypothetical protein
MSEHEEKIPAEVLRTKRLEIVDDEGKVRAVLGIDEAGQFFTRSPAPRGQPWEGSPERCSSQPASLEAVMNSIRNGLGMRETEIARGPS